jgi:hypothetical protein
LTGVAAERPATEGEGRWTVVKIGTDTRVIPVEGITKGY